VTDAPESDAVLAFIRERQGEVLAEAVRQMAACSPDDRAAVAHAVSGSLGSYQLTDAYEQVMAVRAMLEDDTASPTDVDGAWEAAVDALRTMETSPHP
jgi:hypothetical protein